MQTISSHTLNHEVALVYCLIIVSLNSCWRFAEIAVKYLHMLASMVLTSRDTITIIIGCTGLRFIVPVQND